MTDARAALVERVRGEFWTAHPHIRGGATFDEVIEFFLKRERVAMEQTRDACADILKTQRFEMARGAQCIALIEVLENRLRSMPLPDATGLGDG